MLVFYESSPSAAVLVALVLYVVVCARGSIEDAINASVLLIGMLALGAAFGWRVFLPSLVSLVPQWDGPHLAVYLYLFAFIVAHSNAPWPAKLAHGAAAWMVHGLMTDHWTVQWYAREMGERRRLQGSRMRLLHTFIALVAAVAFVAAFGGLYALSEELMTMGFGLAHQLGFLLLYCGALMLLGGASIPLCDRFLTWCDIR